MRLLKAFVVGSSLFVVFLFLIATGLNKNKNYSYEMYSIVAPLFFGLMSVLLSYMFTKPELKHYLITGVITSLFVLVLNYNLKTYPFTSWQEWVRYYSHLLPAHLFAFAMIYFLITNI